MADSIEAMFEFVIFSEVFWFVDVDGGGGSSDRVLLRVFGRVGTCSVIRARTGGGGLGAWALLWFLAYTKHVSFC